MSEHADRVTEPHVQQADAPLTGFEPVRFYRIEDVPDDVVLRPFNFELTGTGLDPNAEQRVVLSLVAVRSLPATKVSPPRCELVFRSWVDVTSPAFALEACLQKMGNSIVVSQFASSAFSEGVKPARRIRVTFKSLEVLPFDLDMRDYEHPRQAMERVLLHGARYEMLPVE